MHVYLGKTLIFAGIAIVALGLLLLIFPKVPMLGKLPGDIMIDKPNFKLYLPITTSILISIVLSLILFLTGRK